MLRSIFFFSSVEIVCHSSAILSPLRLLPFAVCPLTGTAKHSYLSRRPSHAYISILLLCLLALPSQVLETSHFKCILTGCCGDKVLTRWPGTDWICNACGMASHLFFLLCSSSSILRHRECCLSIKMILQCFPNLSISLGCFVPDFLFLFTQQRKQVYKTWHVLAHSHCHHPMWSKAAKEKEAHSVIFQTPLFISHSLDKLLPLFKIASISMLERNDKSLEVKQQVDQRLSSDNAVILSGGNTTGLLPK